MSRAILQEYIQQFCKIMDTSWNAIISKDRSRNIADKRMILGYIINNIFELTLSDTGRLLCRNHATIMHYNKILPDIVQQDKLFASLYNQAKVLAYAYDEDHEYDKKLVDMLLTNNHKLRKIIQRKDEELKLLYNENRKLRADINSIKYGYYTDKAKALQSQE